MKPGVYMQEQLLSWKQMDSFNYFQSGYEEHCFPTSLVQKVILKAKVNPSQKSPDSNQEARLIADKLGKFFLHVWKVCSFAVFVAFSVRVVSVWLPSCFR